MDSYTMPGDFNAQRMARDAQKVADDAMKHIEIQADLLNQLGKIVVGLMVRIEAMEKNQPTD